MEEESGGGQEFQTGGQVNTEGRRCDDGDDDDDGQGEYVTCAPDA